MGLAVPAASLEGAPGTPGATPVLQAGNASALPYGSAPQVALRVTAPNTYALDVSWPLAKDGTPGGKGDAGATPTLQIGNVTALAAGAAATAAVRAIGGNAYAIDLGIPVGAAGGKGDAGATPTLQIGNVTTLAAGAQATAAVRSVGGTAYAIDLGLPVGTAGAAGVAAWGAVAPWAANTNYTSNAPASIVTYDDGGGTQTYVAKAGVGAFTSGTTFNAANWTLIAARAAAGAAKVTKRTLLGIMRISDSGTFTVSAADAAYPDWNELDARPVSGGGSGMTSAIGAGGHVGCGGQGGAVAFRGGILRSELLAAGGSVAVTVGLGGVVPTADSFYRTNGGDPSAFGSYVRSAPGVTLALPSNITVTLAYVLALMASSSIYTQALPGMSPRVLLGSSANGSSPTGAFPSLGPGVGGGGAYASTNVNFAGGAGGIGDFGGAQTAGGAAGGAGNGGPGSDGAPGSFGGGGGGAGVNTGTPYATAGGKGGFPGGGGGGSALTNAASSYQYGAPGAGGKGCVDLFIYKRVAE